MDKKVLTSKNESFDWEASKRRVSFNPYRPHESNGHENYSQDEDTVLLNEAQTVLHQINSVNCYPSKQPRQKSSFYHQFSSLPSPHKKVTRKSSPNNNSGSNSYHPFNTNIVPEDPKQQHYIVHTVIRPSSSNSNVSSNNSNSHLHNTKGVYLNGRHSTSPNNNGYHGSLQDLNNMSSHHTNKFLVNARVPKLAEKIRSSSDNKNPPPSHYLYSRPQENHSSYSNMEPFSYTKPSMEKNDKNKEIIYAQVVVGGKGSKTRNNNSSGLINSGKRTVHKTFHNNNNNETHDEMYNGHYSSSDQEWRSEKPLLKNNVTTVLLNNNDDDYPFYSRDRSPSPEPYFRTPFSSAKLVKEADRQRDSYLPSAKLVNNYHYDDHEDVTFANSKRRYYSDNIYSNRNAPNHVTTNGYGNHPLYDDKHDLGSTYFGNGESKFERENFGSSKYYGFDNGDNNEEQYMNESNNFYSSYPRRPPLRQKHTKQGNFSSGNKKYGHYRDNNSKGYVPDKRSEFYPKGGKDFNFNEEDEDFMREDSPSDFRIEQNTRVSDKYGFFGENASQTLPSNYRSKVKSSPSFGGVDTSGNNKYRSSVPHESPYDFDDNGILRSTTPLKKKAESTSALHALKRTKSNVDKTKKPMLSSPQQSIFSTLLRRNKSTKSGDPKVKSDVKSEKKSKGNFISSFLDRNFGSSQNKQTHNIKPANKTTSTLSTTSNKNRIGRNLITSRDSTDTPERSKDIIDHKRTSEDQKFYTWSSEDEPRTQQRNPTSSSKLLAKESQDDYRQQLSQRYGSLGRPLRSNNNNNDNENLEYGNQSKSLDRRAFANSMSKTVPPKIVVTPSNSDAMDKVGGSKARLRYFGETDAEDGTVKWSSAQARMRLPNNNASTLNRKSTTGPSHNDSESDTGLGPMATPVNRLASASSTATGGSSRSVYLHAAAVADIPPGTQMQNRTLSKDNISNYSGYQKTSKQLGRSLSVLAPWRPRNVRDRYELTYDNNMQRPPRPPRSPNRRSDEDSPRPTQQMSTSSESLLKPKGIKNNPPKAPLRTNRQSNATVSRSKSMPKDSRFANWFNRRRK